MLKKIALAAFVMSSMLVVMPQAAVAGPDDGCNLGCVWFEERNEHGDIIGGHWVCGVPICQDQVEP
ncbi:MAG: hypothetical protein Q8M32_02405 [Brevundimonas sp.]|nr:hypothetical protein [Brevundimonas sp.]